MIPLLIRLICSSVIFYLFFTESQGFSAKLFTIPLWTFLARGGIIVSQYQGCDNLKNLRKRFNRFCFKYRDKGIPNLMLYIIIGSAIVMGLYYLGYPQIYNILSFDRSAILKGQVWRLFSYVFTSFSVTSNLLLVAISYVCYFSLGRAIENSCYLMAGGQCGVKYDGPTYGRSLIIDPWGNIIAKASDKPCVITAEIDPEYRMKVKKQVITLENRREDVYRLFKK